VTVNLQATEKPGSPLVPFVVRVRDCRQETHDSFTLALEAPAGFCFRPGQFNMLYVFGVGEAAISLSGDAADEQTVVHTIRAVGSVTQALARLGPAQAVGMRGPFGSAWPLEAARGCDVVLVAGGIGAAPLRPVLYHLLRRREEYRRITLLYGVRTPGDLLYAAELDQWRQRDVQALVTVNHGDASWRGSIGMVTELFAQVEFDPKQTIGLMCGPEVMLRFAQREFEKRGVNDDQLYLSLERNMRCAVGFCGHCQLGPEFICVDGPVFRYDRIKLFFNLREA
jgi:NAD(P)H-flavin reductase